MKHKLTPKKEPLGLLEATGRVLAQAVVADRDFPPFDRVTMDGIAIKHSAWENGRRTFALAGTQLAGEAQKILTDETAAIEVMTGAVLPAGCDTVVVYEEIDISNNAATVNGPVKLRQNVHSVGSDQKSGTVLLAEGTLLGSAEIAILATVGVARPLVYTPPRIAVIATGDELVPVEHTPAPYQIRSSNSQSLAAALQEWKIAAPIYHLKDNKQELTAKLTEILRSADVLLLSGGVSKGKADYLPEVLEAVGIKCVFHRVAQKPGKPLWFGTRGDEKFVFAFPGNPISTFMCFHRYFLLWLRHSLELAPAVEWARISESFNFAPSLTYFLQVKATLNSSGEIWATPKTGGGSGDLANLLYSNAFLELPAERSNFEKGEAFRLFRFKPLY